MSFFKEDDESSGMVCLPHLIISEGGKVPFSSEHYIAEQLKFTKAMEGLLPRVELSLHFTVSDVTARVVGL